MPGSDPKSPVEQINPPLRLLGSGEVKAWVLFDESAFGGQRRPPDKMQKTVNTIRTPSWNRK